MHSPYNPILSVIRRQFYGVAYHSIMRGLIKELFGVDPGMLDEVEAKKQPEQKQLCG